MGSLKNLIRQRRLTPQATLEIALQVCAGLEYAHKLGEWSLAAIGSLRS